jgi:hypothetical protein
VFEGDDLYLSYLYRYDTGFVDDNDFVVWWFNDETGPVIGLKGNGGNGSQPEDLIARVGNFFEPPRQEYAPDVDISEEEGTTWEDVVSPLGDAGVRQTSSRHSVPEVSKSALAPMRPPPFQSPRASQACSRHC